MTLTVLNTHELSIHYVRSYKKKLTDIILDKLTNRKKSPSPNTFSCLTEHNAKWKEISISKKKNPGNVTKVQKHNTKRVFFQGKFGVTTYHMMCHF